MAVPDRVLDRDFGETREANPEVIEVLRSIYEDRSPHWDHYETCEALLDIGNNFQFFPELLRVRTEIGANEEA